MEAPKLKGLEDILADSFGRTNNIFADNQPIISPGDAVATPPTTPPPNQGYTNLENLTNQNVNTVPDTGFGGYQPASPSAPKLPGSGGYQPPMQNQVPKSPSIVPRPGQIKPGSNPFAPGNLGTSGFTPPQQGGGKGGKGGSIPNPLDAASGGK